MKIFYHTLLFLLLFIIFKSFFNTNLYSQSKSIDYLSYNYDLQIKSSNVTFDKKRNSFTSNTIIYNSGLKTAYNFNIIICISNSTNPIIDTLNDITVYKAKIDSLLSKDSIIIKVDFSHNSQKTKKLKTFIDFPLDMKLDNNFNLQFFSNPLLPFSILINEIMYNPLPNNSEYLELFNNTNDSINLINWKILDQYTTSGRRNEIVISNEVYIKSKDYITISADSSIFNLFPYLKNCKEKVYVLNKSSLNLNNDEDEIVIYDLNGDLQDSMKYSDKWHNPNISNSKGTSLEKINTNLISKDRNNWSSSTNILGGTPSKINSVFKDEMEIIQNKVEILPNPFSPNDDGFEDNTLIKISSEFNTAFLRIRIFDKNGRIRKNLINNKAITNHYEVIWDGKDDEGKTLHTGIYIVFVELIDDSNGVTKSYKVPVVIAKKI